FRRGEYVRIGEIEGTVMDLGVLSTKVRTVKQELMSLPNSLVLTTGTRNYSRHPGEHGILLHTSVTIGYDAPWRLVRDMLIEAARRTAELEREPAPFVLQRSLSDFYVEYEINAYLRRPELRIRVLAELHSHIQDCFNENSVQIMSPHFLTQPERAIVVPKSKWNPAMRGATSAEPGPEPRSPDPGGGTES